MGWAIVFGVATALANAVAVASQHVASTSVKARQSLLTLLRRLLRHPLWLAGWLALCASAIFQTIALHFGPLSLVQPLLISELVIALVLRWAVMHQQLRRTTWLAAVVTASSLALFLVILHPSSTNHRPSATSWWSSSTLCITVTLVLVVLARRGAPNVRAGLYAVATAIMWALEATYLKASAGVITQDGLGALLVRWPLYAVIGAGLLGLWSEQSALHVGPLSVSQPLIVIVDPLTSIALGVALYHEQFGHGVTVDFVGALLFAIVIRGVVVLAATAPDNMRPTPSDVAQ